MNLREYIAGPIIGQLVTKDEMDFLPQVMEWATPWCDAIYALVGDDASETFLAGNPKVKRIFRDNACGFESFTDNRRQILLEAAQKDFPPKDDDGSGVGGWFFLLHGDEIWYDDPVTALFMADMVDQRGNETDCDTVVCNMAQSYLHPEGGDWVAFPACKEQRAFKNVGGLHFPHYQQHKTTPLGISQRHFSGYYPVIRHYSYRNPDQAWRVAWSQHTRRRCRQESHDWILDQRTCYTTIDPNTGDPIIRWEDAASRIQNLRNDFAREFEFMAHVASERKRENPRWTA